jgi:hypothetical protein
LIVVVDLYRFLLQNVTGIYRSLIYWLQSSATIFTSKSTGREQRVSLSHLDTGRKIQLATIHIFAVSSGLQTKANAGIPRLVHVVHSPWSLLCLVVLSEH